MNEKRVLEFVENFEIDESFVEMAYEKVYHKLEHLGYTGEELRVSTELTIFNIFGFINCRTDIFTVILRAPLAFELFQAFNPHDNGKFFDVFNYKDIRNMADDLMEERHKMKIEDIEKIESDIEEHGLGHAPYGGLYDKWEEAGHTCPFEYCIKTFPLEEGSETKCHIFGHDCPGEIKTKNQNLESEHCIFG